MPPASLWGDFCAWILSLFGVEPPELRLRGGFQHDNKVMNCMCFSLDRPLTSSLPQFACLYSPVSVQAREGGTQEAEAQRGLEQCWSLTQGRAAPLGGGWQAGTRSLGTGAARETADSWRAFERKPDW